MPAFTHNITHSEALDRALYEPALQVYRQRDRRALRREIIGLATDLRAIAFNFGRAFKFAWITVGRRFVRGMGR